MGFYHLSAGQPKTLTCLIFLSWDQIYPFSHLCCVLSKPRSRQKKRGKPSAKLFPFLFWSKLFSHHCNIILSEALLLFAKLFSSLTKTESIYRVIFKALAHPFLAILHQNLLLLKWNVISTVTKNHYSAVSIWWNENLKWFVWVVGGFCFVLFFKWCFHNISKCCHFFMFQDVIAVCWLKRGAQSKCFNRNLRRSELEEINFTPDIKRWSST